MPSSLMDLKKLSRKIHLPQLHALELSAFPLSYQSFDAVKEFEKFEKTHQCSYQDVILDFFERFAQFVRQTAVFSWQVNTFLKKRHPVIPAAEDALLCHLCRGYQQLQLGLRFHRADMEYKNAKSDILHQEKGFTGMSIDDIVGTDRVGRGPLPCYPPVVQKVYKKSRVLKNMTEQIAMFLKNVHDDVIRPYCRHARRDWGVDQAASARAEIYFIFQTIPPSFRGEHWDLVSEWVLKPQGSLVTDFVPALRALSPSTTNRKHEAGAAVDTGNKAASLKKAIVSTLKRTGTNLNGPKLKRQKQKNQNVCNSDGPGGPTTTKAKSGDLAPPMSRQNVAAPTANSQKSSNAKDGTPYKSNKFTATHTKANGESRKSATLSLQTSYVKSRGSAALSQNVALSRKPKGPTTMGKSGDLPVTSTSQNDAPSSGSKAVEMIHHKTNRGGATTTKSSNAKDSSSNPRGATTMGKSGDLAVMSGQIAAAVTNNKAKSDDPAASSGQKAALEANNEKSNGSGHSAAPTAKAETSTYTDDLQSDFDAELAAFDLDAVVASASSSRRSSNSYPTSSIGAYPVMGGRTKVGIYRCISLNEGGSVLGPFLKCSRDQVDIMDFATPPLMKAARFFNSRIQGGKRIGVISHQLQANSGMVVEYPIVDCGQQVLLLVAWVQSGKYSMSGIGSHLNPGEWTSFLLSKTSCQTLTSLADASSVTLFVYFNRHTLDYLGTLNNDSTLQAVKDGFTQSGLMIRHPLKDRHVDQLLIPVYGKNFNQDMTADDSLIEAMELFFERNHSSVNLTENARSKIKSIMTTRNWTDQVLCGIEAIVRNETQSEFRLCLIDNTVDGLRKSGWAGSGVRCTVYLHHPCHPTFPSHERIQDKRFVLVESQDSVEERELVAFEGTTYPSELQPYDTTVDKNYNPTPVVSSMLAFNRGDCSCVLLTEEQCEVVPQVAYLKYALPEDAGDAFDVMFSQSDVMRDQDAYLNDHHLGFLISGTRMKSRNETVPKTLVVDSLTSMIMMSGNFQDVNARLIHYHRHNTEDLDVFELDQLYILFKCNEHFILAVVVNPGGLISGTDSGILFMDSLNWHETQKGLVKHVQGWLSYEYHQKNHQKNTSSAHPPVTDGLKTWHLSMRKQSDGTSCLIHSTMYLHQCYVNSSDIFTESNIIDGFKNIPTMECFRKDIDVELFRKVAASIIDLIRDNMSKDTSTEVSNDMADLCHPGDYPVKNIWEANVYGFKQSKKPSTQQRKNQRIEAKRAMHRASLSGMLPSQCSAPSAATDACASKAVPTMIDVTHCSFTSKNAMPALPDRVDGASYPGLPSSPVTEETFKHETDSRCHGPSPVRIPSIINSSGSGSSVSKNVTPSVLPGGADVTSDPSLPVSSAETFISSGSGSSTSENVMPDDAASAISSGSGSSASKNAMPVPSGGADEAAGSAGSPSLPTSPAAETSKQVSTINHASGSETLSALVSPQNFLRSLSKSSRDLLRTSRPCTTGRSRTAKKKGKSKNVATTSLSNDFNEYHERNMKEINTSPGLISLSTNGTTEHISPEDKVLPCPPGISSLLPMLNKSCAWDNFIRVTTLMSKLTAGVEGGQEELKEDQLHLLYGKLSSMLDFHKMTNLQLACFSQTSSLVIFCPNFTRCKPMKILVSSILSERVDLDDKCGVLLLVHGPASLQGNQVEESIRDSFFEVFDVVSCLAFSSSREEGSERLLMKHIVRSYPGYEGCGPCAEFLMSLAQGYLVCQADHVVREILGQGESVSVSITPMSSLSKTVTCDPTSYSTTEIQPFRDSWVHFLTTHIANRPQIEKHWIWSQAPVFRGVLGRALSTSDIIRVCPIAEAKGSVCIDIGRVLDNLHKLGHSGVHAEKYTQAEWAKLACSLELAFMRSMFLYLCTVSEQYRIGCMCCRSDICIPCNGSYASIHDAMKDLLPKSKEHRALASLRKCMKKSQMAHHTSCSVAESSSYLEGRISSRDLIGSTDAGQGVYECHNRLNRTELDSCIGNDQLVNSTVLREQGCKKPREAARYCESIMETVFSPSAKDAHAELEDKFRSIIDGAKISDIFSNEAIDESIALDVCNDSGWKSCEDELSSILCKTASRIMQVDWQHDSFPRKVPDDFDQLDEEDKLTVNDTLRQNRWSFHQTGLLMSYLESTEEDSQESLVYRLIPRVALAYAFPCANGCADVYTKAGREEHVSPKLYVIQSLVPVDKIDADLVSILSSDKDIDIVEAGHEKITIEWVANEAIVGGTQSILSERKGHKAFLDSLRHGEWKKLLRTAKMAIAQSESDCKRLSFEVMQLHPFLVSAKSHQRYVVTKGREEAEECMGFAQMQHAIESAFCEGTYKLEIARERLTNSCFQERPGATLCREATIVQSIGCAVQSDQYPSCISGSPKFSEVVDLSKWNCALSNASNLLQCMGQYDDKMKTSFARIQENNQGNMFNTLKKTVQSCGYEVYALPPDVDYKALSYFCENLCLPMIVSIDLSFASASYQHIIGIRPFKPPAGDEVEFQIIDGSHSDLRPIELSATNMDWCCGKGRNFTRATNSFAFFPANSRSKEVADILTRRFKTEEEFDASGLTVCVSLCRTVRSVLKKCPYMEKSNTVPSELLAGLQCRLQYWNHLKANQPNSGHNEENPLSLRAAKKRPALSASQGNVATAEAGGAAKKVKSVTVRTNNKKSRLEAPKMTPATEKRTRVLGVPVDKPVETLNPLRNRRKRSGGDNSTHNAGEMSSEAIRNLLDAQAINPKVGKVREKEERGGLNITYPEELCGPCKCHLRALYHVSPAASEEAHTRRVSYKDLDTIKEIARKHSNSDLIKVYQLRKTHWVCVTPKLYIDDAYCYHILHYERVTYVLDLLESCSESVFGGTSSSFVLG